MAMTRSGRQSAHGQGAEAAKRIAAVRALDFVEPGMKLGLGSGSTANHFIECLGEKVRGGLSVVGVPTSVASGRLAERCRIPLTTLDEAGWLDLTIDGADEVDDDITLIKGGGGALLIEKIVASASDRMIVIADASKRVTALGAFPLPVEVTPFGWETTRAVIDTVLKSCDVDARESVLRMKGDAPFLTDEGNLMVDLHLQRIGAPLDLAYALNAVPGVVESGLFIDMADGAIIADENAVVEVLTRPDE